MAETIPPLSVTRQKDIRIVEFTNNRILDEANIAEIGQGLNVLIDERPNPKILLDFSTVDRSNMPHPFEYGQYILSKNLCSKSPFHPKR